MNIMIELKISGNIRHSCQFRADFKALIYVSIELLKVICLILVFKKSWVEEHIEC